MDKNKKTNKIAIFEGGKIRRVWNENEEKWYFSVVDVVKVLTNSVDPFAYWRKLKERMKAEGGNESVTKCHALKMMAADGKMRITDTADTETMFRLIQSIPSPKAEPFKLWLARVGYERVEEMEDPEKAIQRAMANYLELGYSQEWVDLRLKSIEIMFQTKKIILGFIVAVFALFILFQPVFAAPKTIGDSESVLTKTAGQTGIDMTKTDVSELIGDYIKIALSLIGLIFFILIFYAGYNWLTSRGEEEKIATSRNTIIAAVIGLFIVLAGYGITYLITDNIINLKGGSVLPPEETVDEPYGCCFDRVQVACDDPLAMSLPKWVWRMTTERDCYGRCDDRNDRSGDCLTGTSDDVCQFHVEWKEKQCEEEWNKL